MTKIKSYGLKSGERTYEFHREGIYVEVFNNNMNDALKRLRNKINKEGVLKDLKKHESYERPGIRIRRKRKEAILRQKKAEFLKQKFEFS